jgi:class 3 adenylate cyclase/tetratricopeptide (TPR) repeat protein
MFDAVSTDTSSEAEVKLITILFADIAQSTKLTERVGSEAARAIFDRCLQRMSSAIDEMGGMVARLMGDGLLAFFGAPRAHEDDAERAALAALRIHQVIQDYAQEIDQSIQIRVGINTGRVIMGEVGGEIASEYTAMGPPIVLAERLQSSAKPSSTLMGYSSARLIRHRFELESAGSQTFKGFDQPQEVFNLIEELSEPETAKGIAGLYSPMVGRDDERQKLAERISLLSQGQGGITTIIGEPGIGKSRMILDAQEFYKNGPVYWAQGRAYSYTEDQPFSVMLDLIAELLDIVADDTPAIIDLKLETALKPLVSEKIDHVWPHLASLLGSPIPVQYQDQLAELDAEGRNAKIVLAVQILLESVAQKQPLALSFEDLHWADASSLSLISSLLLASESNPILIVLRFRPERDKPCWELKLKAETDFPHRYQELVLSPLTDAQSAEMIENLLEVANFPGSLRELIRSKSEGNPFYVEELIRELIEQEVLVRQNGSWEMVREISEIEIPNTLEKVIQARLDRLPSQERATLQAASVIGRRFGYRVLEVMTAANGQLPQQLLKLQQSDLVRERSRIPELEYIFKHVIVQEVTYGTLLEQQRRELHQRAAQTLEELFPQRREELLGSLADHYAAAGEQDKAVELYILAGDRAQDMFAHEEARQFLKNASDMLEPDRSPELCLQLFEKLGDTHRHLGEGPEAIPAFQKALALVEGADRWTSVRLHRKIGDTVTRIHKQANMLPFDDAAQASFQVAKALTEDQAPHQETVRLLLALVFRNINKTSEWPDWQAASKNAHAAVKMAEQLGDPVLHSASLGHLTPVLFNEGQYTEQLEIAMRRLELSQQAGFNDLRERLLIKLELGIALKNVGKFEESLAPLREAAQEFKQISDVNLEASSLGILTESLFRLDRWEEVLEIEERLIELNRVYGTDRAGPLCYFLGFSATVNALRGSMEVARELRAEAYDIMLEAGGVPEEQWMRNQHY